MNDAIPTYEAQVIPRDPEVARRVERMERLARLLDEAWRIPGTNYRVGIDSLIGLIPGAGDVITSTLSAYVVYEAQQLGLPRHVVARMIGNLGIDFVVGAIPLLGDLFDVAFKANKRNMQLFNKYSHRARL
ncbi:MAG: DUF4112 domain-containing protein [Candidatus Hydrogenedentes bacterium]|nr:DUF4112 domain-containing protein [Candidatus Hydrogenedentota bacterium]